jgi:hypothetical protein
MGAGASGVTGQRVRTPLKLGSTGDIDMNFKAIVHGIALIAVLGFISAGQAARADDCDDEQDELKKLIERVINYTPNPQGIGPVCAATGQILGVTKAAREVAAECYDDGRKRTKILEEYDKGIQEMESKINGVCK